MDVLQIVKTDHEKIIELLNRLIISNKINERKKLFSQFKSYLTCHLMLEKDYLFPEIAGTAESLNRSIELAVGREKELLRLLAKTQDSIKSLGKSPKSFNNYLKKLQELLLSHFSEENERIIPKFRELIPTQGREDLGELFLEIISERTSPLTTVSA